MNPSPTIKTLAEMAGVSTATVSLALRNHPRISLKVRERIQQIATKAGYQANPIVANLFAQLRQSKAVTFKSTLGLLYLGKNPEYLKTVPTYREWLTGCTERASSLGYGLDSFSLNKSEISPQRILRILNARGITGLMLIGPFENNTIQAELDPVWQRSAAIVLGVRPIHPALTFVSNDQFATIENAMDELFLLGYKRPGLCIHPHVDNAVEKRFSGGFYVSQSTLPPKSRIPIFAYESGAGEQFKLWINQHRPDAILTLHCEIEAWIKSMGLRIPRDIGLVHLDKSSGIEWAGMQQNNEYLGRAAVDMVIGQLHRSEYGIPPFQKSVFITSTWSPGPTLRIQVTTR